MNIANLEAYVESRNAWAKIFGNKELSLLNKADRQTIANALDADLSPENLSCDGEVRGAQLQRKYQYLSRCAEELLSIDSAVTFNEYN